MSENRVIGAGGKIPWHLPEDFKWFRQVTTGHWLVMGRKTFESIGRPLPGRETAILSRTGFAAPGVHTVPSIEALDTLVGGDSRDVFVAGGAEIYSLLLTRCSDLFLTRVKRLVPGDTYFPPFETNFSLIGTPIETEEFVVEHYQPRPRWIA